MATERETQIMELVLRHGEVTVEELARRLGVSAATVRRDLTEMERRGMLRRTHGGAATLEPLLYEPFRHLSSFQEQEQQLSAEKRAIGLAASELVRDGETVAVGAGTTTTQVARSLRHRQGLTLVTNAVNIAMEMSHIPALRVFLTGGFLSGDWFAMVGPTAIQSAGELFTDHAFIGADGIHPEHGITTNYPEQAFIHRALLRQARCKIVVADHRKLGQTGTARICAAREIDLIITDRGATNKAVAPFIKLGIEVQRV